MTHPRQSDTVYVLEVGCYENHMIWGVYGSAEAAMAAHKTRKKQTWTQHEVDCWSNDLDWDDAATVHSYEVSD